LPINSIVGVTLTCDLSITTTKCSHLIVDAGHIAIESDLADKESVIKVQSRRKQEYTEEDYKRLESLMYDKFTLKLESAQVCLQDQYLKSTFERCRSSYWATTSRHAAGL
jgi:hypothetical protein